MVGMGDSPSTSGEDPSVLNPCDLKWLCNRGNKADLSNLGMLCNVCGCGFVEGMLARMGEGLIDLHGVGVVVNCFCVGRIHGGM